MPFCDPDNPLHDKDCDGDRRGGEVEREGGEEVVEDDGLNRRILGYLQRLMI